LSIFDCPYGKGNDGTTLSGMVKGNTVTVLMGMIKEMIALHFWGL
jgi:hypothetical protein